MNTLTVNVTPEHLGNYSPEYDSAADPSCAHDSKKNSLRLDLSS